MQGIPHVDGVIAVVSGPWRSLPLPFRTYLLHVCAISDSDEVRSISQWAMTLLPTSFSMPFPSGPAPAGGHPALPDERSQLLHPDDYGAAVGHFRSRSLSAMPGSGQGPRTYDTGEFSASERYDMVLPN